MYDQSQILHDRILSSQLTLEFNLSLSYLIFKNTVMVLVANIWSLFCLQKLTKFQWKNKNKFEQGKNITQNIVYNFMTSLHLNKIHTWLTHHKFLAGCIIIPRINIYFISASTLEHKIRFIANKPSDTICIMHMYQNHK